MDPQLAVSLWYVYIVRCADDTLYTGITTEPKRRVNEHNTEGLRGARYTATRRPVSLVYIEQAPSRSVASQRELIIKKLNRKCKLALCTCHSSNALLATAV